VVSQNVESTGEGEDVLAPLRTPTVLYSLDATFYGSCAMNAPLLACSACGRHVRANESRCPFCSVVLAKSFGSRPIVVSPPAGLGRGERFQFARAATAAGVSVLAAATLAACYGLPPTIPSSCCAKEYVQDDFGQCSCPDGTPYLTCVDGTFSGCSCTVPAGYTLAPDGGEICEDAGDGGKESGEK
jgi:hypothetical protein